MELVTNFNYKAAFCNVELGNYDEAVKHLNKTIDMLNEKGRLDKNLEDIYQKCSFEKDRLMYKNNVEDKRFSNFKFLSTKTSIIALIIIIIAYIILKRLDLGKQIIKLTKMDSEHFQYKEEIKRIPSKSYKRHIIMESISMILPVFIQTVRKN